MASERKLLLPYDGCEIDAIEGWLDEQAREGWRLDSIDGMHFYFTRPDDTTLTRYRIDVLPNKVPDLEERRATFDDLGWEYIATLFDNFDIYAAARPDAVEINTDEELLRQQVTLSGSTSSNTTIPNGAGLPRVTPMRWQRSTPRPIPSPWRATKVPTTGRRTAKSAFSYGTAKSGWWRSPMQAKPHCGIPSPSLRFIDKNILRLH